MPVSPFAAELFHVKQDSRKKKREAASGRSICSSRYCVSAVERAQEVEFVRNQKKTSQNCKKMLAFPDFVCYNH